MRATEKAKQKMRERYQRNRERLRGSQREYHNRPEVREARIRRDLKNFYGITLEQYNQMVIDQGGKCPLCTRHQDELTRRLVVDHCHETGRVRGLLCNECNKGIGLLKDNPSIMERAIRYVNKDS